MPFCRGPQSCSNTRWKLLEHPWTRSLDTRPHWAWQHHCRCVLGTVGVLKGGGVPAGKGEPQTLEWECKKGCKLKPTGKHPGPSDLLDTIAGTLTTNHILDMRNSGGPTKLTKWQGCEAVTEEDVRDMKTKCYPRVLFKVWVKWPNVKSPLYFWR